MKHMPSENRPDPDSNYLSKYLLDFNKRELDKFLHPEKFPKVVLSISALGVVVFLFVAWMFPLKDALLNKKYEKSPVSADQEKEIQNLSLLGPQSAKTGDKIRLIVAVRSDKKSGVRLKGTIQYPENIVKLESVKSLLGDNKMIKADGGFIKFDQEFSPPLQTSGANQELILIVFETLQQGRANFTFDDMNTYFSDAEYQIIPMQKNNYSLIITQ